MTGLSTSMGLALATCKLFLMTCLSTSMRLALAFALPLGAMMFSIVLIILYLRQLEVRVLVHHHNL